MSRRAVASVLVAAVLAACDYRPSVEFTKRGRVRVAAAADLRFALNDIVRRFESSRDIEVQTTFGSSGTFYAQLMNRAPFDVFLSADIEYPRQLAAHGLTLPDTEFTYAVGRLVVWTSASSRIDPAGGVALVAGPSVKHLAIANPAHAPYGRAAVAAMRAAGVYEAAQPKLVYGENVEQALQYAQSGAADAGIVALSLALAPPVKSQGRFVDVPLDSYPRILQGGVILRWAANAEAARALRAFLIDEEGRDVLKQYGFFMPDQ